MHGHSEFTFPIGLAGLICSVSFAGIAGYATADGNPNANDLLLSSLIGPALGAVAGAFESGKKLSAICGGICTGIATVSYGVGYTINYLSR